MESAELQGALWSRAAHDWAELQEPMGLPLWDAMLDAAAVASGTHVLDAGCGAGGAGMLAAGRGARVNGLDAANALVAIARRCVPDADFRVGALEALPYADATFDAVLCANVMQYAADPLRAARELRRVCASGGRVVIATWAAPEVCDQRVITAALRALLPRPLVAEPFALSRPGVLDALVMHGGLRVVGEAVVACPWVYPDLETAWQAQVSAGPLQAALDVVGEARLKAAVLRALAPFGTSTGGVCMQNYARFLTAAPAATLAPAARTPWGSRHRKGGATA